MSEKELPYGARKRDFAMDFVGFSTYTGSMAEATIAIHPDYDLAGVVSSFVTNDGSRVITLIFNRAEKKLGRRGYDLEQKWEQLPDGQQSLSSKEMSVKT